MDPRRQPEIIAEQPDQRPAIRALYLAAFPSAYEADLVERLRASGLVVVARVVRDGHAILAHILFSDLSVEVDGRRVAAVSLAPVAVAPAVQRIGIGTVLIRAGLLLVRERGCDAVIVVGDPAYYARFGFSAELAEKLHSPWTGPAFMALELTPGALAGRAGRVSYPAAFDVA